MLLCVPRQGPVDKRDDRERLEGDISGRFALMLVVALWRRARLSCPCLDLSTSDHGDITPMEIEAWWPCDFSVGSRRPPLILAVLTSAERV